MTTKTGTFSFKVPESSPVEAERGIKTERTFDYQQVDSNTEAEKVIADKEWTLAGLVNDILKANARSNAYQAALAPHKVSEVSQDDIIERMVRDYIRLGIAENVARNMVTSALAAK